MPLRATKRGSERTALERDCDVLICGASFAGLAVARALEGSGAHVLMVDRYELGERATSACGIPTLWLEALDLLGSERQRFGELLIHTQFDSFRYRLPWTFSTFDYRELCAGLFAQAPTVELDTATVESITRRSGRVTSGTLAGESLHTVHTDRGELRAPLVVDALGWRRMLAHGKRAQPHRRARLSRGLEVHPHASGEDMEVFIDPRYVTAGYGWSFPAGEELRVGVGSFRPADHVRAPTELLAADRELPTERFQGNWIPHKLRPATDDGVFMVGDSAGHCLPLTAEGIRTALYFGLACGRELRGVIAGQLHRETALERYGAFSGAHAWQFGWLLAAQRFVSVTSHMPLLTKLIGALERRRIVDYAFGHYLDIAPPTFVREAIASEPAALVPS
jgi:flavin-dependent dehydrogenase